SWARSAENQNCSRFAISSDVIDILTRANCFPATHNIRALLEMFHLEHVFTPRDVNSRVFSFIQRAERLVDALGVEVLDIENVEAPGVDITASPHAEITRAMHLLLATVCSVGCPHLVRAALGFPSSSEISFSGDVTKINKIDTGTVDVDPSEHTGC